MTTKAATNGFVQVGNNVRYAIEDNTLVIRVDLGQDFGPSSSGKTTIVASSCGNVTLPTGDKLGLNVYKPRA